MRPTTARRRLLTAVLVLAGLSALLWLLVLLGVVDGAGATVLRTVAWLMTAVTGGTAIGLRDANRVMEKGMRTPPRRTPPSEDDSR